MSRSAQALLNIYFYYFAIARTSTLSDWTKTNVALNPYQGRACGYNTHSEELIILGGYESSVYDYISFDVTSYSITNDNTQSLSSLSTSISIACYGRCYTQYNDKLYFISNYKLGVYNLEQKQVTYPLSQKQAHVWGARTCIAVSDDDKYVFIIGGSTSSTSSSTSYKTNNFQIYNIAEDTMSNGPPMTTQRSALTCVTSNNYVYAIGGDMGSVHFDTIEKIYIMNINNILSESWHILSSTMPQDANRLECIKFNHDIYILGGSYHDAQTLSTVIRLDTNTDTIYQDTSLPVGMSDICAAITHDARILVSDQENVYWAQIPIETNHPTNKPTEDPTKLTQNPTKDPTKLTMNPTKNPTKLTDNPTKQPTDAPQKQTTAMLTTRNSTEIVYISSTFTSIERNPANNEAEIEDETARTSSIDIETVIPNYRSKPSYYDILIVILVIAIVGVIIIICLYIVMKKRKPAVDEKPKQKQEETQHTDTVQTSYPAMIATSVHVIQQNTSHVSLCPSAMPQESGEGRKDDEELWNTAAITSGANANETAGCEDGKEICADCGLQKNGEIYVETGLFYCNDCWMYYGDVRDHITQTADSN